MENQMFVREYRAACPNCGSTNRTGTNGRVVISGGTQREGVTYTHVAISYTRCRDCGQAYILRQYITHGASDVVTAGRKSRRFAKEEKK